MNFFDAVKSCFSKYFDFKSRASRAEFWYWFLFTIVSNVAIFALIPVLKGMAAILWLVLQLAIIIPSIAVSARRFHDIDKSGFWIFINFVPVIGFFLYLYWMATKGDAKSNRWGAKPKD